MPEYRGIPGRFTVVTIFSALSALTLGGCASIQEAPALATTPVVGPGGIAGTGSNPADQAFLHALTVTRDGAKERRYALTSGTKPSQIHLVRLFAGGGGGGTERWSLTTATTHVAERVAAGSIERLEFELNGEGDVCLHSTTDATEKVLTEFHPPLRVLPAKLVPGEMVSQAFQMIVRPLAKPGTIQNQGPASQDVIHMGLEHITVPAGGFDAHHIRTTLKGTLDTAKITITTDTWFAPPIGIVAETTVQRVTMFGIAVRSSATKLELVQSGTGAAAALPATN